MKLVLRLLSYLKIVRLPFILGLVLLLISSGALQAAPLIVQYIIDNLLTPLTKGATLDSSKLLMLKGLDLRQD